MLEILTFSSATLASPKNEQSYRMSSSVCNMIPSLSVRKEKAEQSESHGGPSEQTSLYS
jgi:hypothetical protein